MRFKKKPIVIEAVMFEKEYIDRALDFCDKLKFSPDNNEYYIETLEGRMKLKDGDFIIKGVKDEFYPCDGGIFEETYEKVN